MKVGLFGAKAMFFYRKSLEAANRQQLLNHCNARSCRSVDWPWFAQVTEYTGDTGERGARCHIAGPAVLSEAWVLGEEKVNILLTYSTSRDYKRNRKKLPGIPIVFIAKNCADSLGVECH